MNAKRQALNEVIFKGRLAALMMEYHVKLVWVEEPPIADYVFRGPGIDLGIARLSRDLGGEPE